MDDAIVAHVKREHGLEIGEGQAEQAKIAIGAPATGGSEPQAAVGGRDLATGQLRRVTLTASDVQRAIHGTVVHILDAVKDTLEQTPPELSSDIAERGITLAGGGALLRGFPHQLSAQTALPVHVVDEPLTCVAVGAGRCLDEFDAIARSARSGEQPSGQTGLR
jgi:rod shape-determining protein MreB and related proteins